jgi:hypothetical protein
MRLYVAENPKLGVARFYDYDKSNGGGLDP